MDLLILGGTVFLGRHLVDAATQRGHAVTLFNRGRSRTVVPAGVTSLRGDRDGGLGALESGRWDAVIDTSGYVPRLVRASASLLGSRAAHYTFISSVSVYDDDNTPDGPASVTNGDIGRVNENWPVHTLDDNTIECVDGETYGALKAMCERAAQSAFAGGCLIVRPGLIVGPHDPTHRFTYWPRRIARGGDVLVPGRPQRVLQFIDARDLAAWIISMVERRQTGVYNATGFEPPTAFGDLAEQCRVVSESDARFVWVDDAFLLEHEVGVWMELPLWIPETPAHAGFYRVDSRKAMAAGLRFRPLEHTVADTLAWTRGHTQAASEGTPVARIKSSDVGLSPEREHTLLHAWRERAAFELDGSLSSYNGL